VKAWSFPYKIIFYKCFYDLLFLSYSQVKLNKDSCDSSSYFFSWSFTLFCPARTVSVTSWTLFENEIFVFQHLKALLLEKILLRVYRKRYWSNEAVSNRRLLNLTDILWNNKKLVTHQAVFLSLITPTNFDLVRNLRSLLSARSHRNNFRHGETNEYANRVAGIAMP